jgi:Zn-dependent protease
LIFLIGFGRGKPVQINPSYYKKPLRDELITSLAGPGMNLLLAIIGMLLMMSYARITDISLETLLHQSFDLVTLFWFMFITINLSLAAFNLLPIFPLDGYRLVKIVWKEGAQRMERNAMIISIVLLVLIL